MANLRDITVREMLSPAHIIENRAKIRDAIRLMRSGRDFLAVVDSDGKLIGSVSENNLVRIVKHMPTSYIGEPVWFDTVEREAGSQPVETIMTTNITTIRPGDSVATAFRVMSSAGYRLLHVIDSKGKLIGTIRMREIFERLLGV